MKRILFATGSSGGGGAGENPPAHEPPASSPPANPPATDPPAENPPPPAPAPPPAATTVLEGTRTERELELEKKLADEQDGRKNDQLRNMELEDENRRLKQIPTEAPKEHGGRWRPFKFKN